MKWLQILGFAWIAAVSAAHAAGDPNNKTEGPVEFYVDVSCFKMLNQNDVSYVQFHFFVQRSAFLFVQNGDQGKASYIVNLRMEDTKNPSSKFERSWTSELSAPMPLDSSKDVPLIFENNFAIKPGIYKTVILIQDQADTARYGKYEESVSVTSFEGNELMVSSLEFASQIVAGGNPEDMFVKNGLTVYPNPSKFFGSNLPRLFLYAEVYNLENKSNAENNTYDVEYIISDESGSVIKQYPAKTMKKAATSAVLLHSLPVISLKTGRYSLLTRVTDNVSKQQAQSKEMFLVFREGESFDEVKSDESYFANLDENAASRAGILVGYVGKSDDKKIFDKLDLAGKREFLDRFWRDRDPSPGTKTNELLIEYYRRLDEAEQRFGSPNIPGWRTDMGRIYITHGPPASIEKHEFESDVVPYQIWFYLQLPNQPTQTIFVFAEKEGTSTLRLIHSNARGEYNNPGYQNELRAIR